MVNYEKALNNALKFSFNWRKFLPYLIFNMIIAIVLIPSAFNIAQAGLTFSETSEIPSSLVNNIIIVSIGGLIAALISILLKITYVHNYSLKKLTIMESLRKIKPRYLTALIATIIIVIFSGIFSSIPVLGGIFSIIISLIVLFVYQEITLKKKGAIKSIKESWHILRKHPRTVIATYIISIIVSIAIIGVLALPLIMVGAKIFIPVITAEVALSSLVNMAMDNIALLGLTGLIAGIGVTIANIFSIAIKTDVYMQIRKRRKLL